MIQWGLGTKIAVQQNQPSHCEGKVSRHGSQSHCAESDKVQYSFWRSEHGELPVQYPTALPTVCR